jgi:hypothetical protein
MRDTTSLSRLTGSQCTTPQIKTILKGQQDFNTGLRQLNLRHENPQHTILVANNVYELRNTGTLAKYFHKAMFSQTKSALLQAVKNFHLTT